NLMVAMTFTVIVISGFMAFFFPFSLSTTGLHALMGFVFILLIGLHISSNWKGLKKSLSLNNFFKAILPTALLTVLFLWQPKPIQKVLGLSNNLGAAQDRFVMNDDGMIYNYTPVPNYKLKLEVRAGKAYIQKSPPDIAIWLENQSSYHIKTLFTSQSKKQLPYWSWKVQEYEKAKEEAKKEKPEDVDDVSGATPNSSFDPKDYILPERNKEAFYLLIEVNVPNDKNEFLEDQPSLIYKVEIDNKHPKTFQVLDLVGYSKYDEEEKEWAAFFVDEKITTALDFIDSSLLTIDR
ncbi:MAG: DUF4405 domain-containing protein, partial [Lentisphaeraceae bacterium]|nr:DUF4405 domain-containing protein [Lentisphaeraceae bacterium]